MGFEHRGGTGLRRNIAPESAIPSCRYYAADTLKITRRSYARLFIGRRNSGPIPIFPSCPCYMYTTPTTLFISQKRVITGKGYVKTNWNPSKSEDSQVCVYWTAYRTEDLIILPRKLLSSSSTSHHLTRRKSDLIGIGLSLVEIGWATVGAIATTCSIAF